MPFVDDEDSNDLMPQNENVFIGRDNEIVYFQNQILKPSKPTHNIIAISGQGGVGKSTLLEYFRKMATSSEFNSTCLTAIVNEKQTTPSAIMEKFAQQLGGRDKFKAFWNELDSYNETLRRMQQEKEAGTEALIEGVADMAGEVISDALPGGKLALKGIKAGTNALNRSRRERLARVDAQRLTDPIQKLTTAFVTDLNKLSRRVILFFDTLEQLGSVAFPWLLDYLLEEKINTKRLIFVLAGRDTLERSPYSDPKSWLTYQKFICQFTLQPFDEEQTREYLAKWQITDSQKVERIWHLSKGLPLFLAFFTFNPQGEVDPTAEVVENFLRWIPEKERRQLALDAALFPRPFNKDELKAFNYVPEAERDDYYAWLIGLPFVLFNDGKHVYHTIARDLFARYQYNQSQDSYNKSLKSIISFYRSELEKLEREHARVVYDQKEGFESSLAMTTLLLLLPVETTHLLAVELILEINLKVNRSQNNEMLQSLKELVVETPSNLCSLSSRKMTRSLIGYLEKKDGDKGLIEDCRFIIGKIAHQPNFSKHIYSHVLARSGEANRYQNNLDKAIEEFSRAIELNPSFGFALNYRGLSYLQKGDYIKALDDLNKVIDLYPTYKIAQLTRGTLHYLMQDNDAALIDLSQTIEPHPTSSFALRILGEIFFQKKDYQGAIEKFSQALEIEDNSPYLLLRRGSASFLQKDYINAKEDLKKLLEIEPKNIVAMTILGVISLVQNEFETSINIIDLLVELDSGNQLGYLTRGMARTQIRNLSGATEDFQRSIELVPSDITSVWMIKWIQFCLELPTSDTAFELEQIAFSNSENYYSLCFLGVAHLLNGDYPKALIKFEDFIRLKPEDWDGFFWQGMALVYLDQVLDAVKAIKHSLKLKLPSILLNTLRWFENDKPDFYQQYAAPILAEYDLLLTNQNDGNLIN